MNKFFKTKWLFGVLLAFTVSSCQKQSQENKSTPVYQPTWESLGQNTVPEWFKDAKFGIYTHWGVYAVPAFGNEWYPRRMYLKSNQEGVYEHHRATWGDPSKFGYKDFIPMFKAERFNADEWADLFKKAGARFVGPVAEHHDGFSMWDSDINEWNAAKMGPKRDVVGELEKAVRKRDMKFVTSFHHIENWFYYIHSEKSFDTADPKYSGLYGPIHDTVEKTPEGDDDGWSKKEKLSDAFMERWFGKLKEVIDRYHPDLIWFDFGLGFIRDDVKQRFVSYYYNEAAKRGQEVVVTYKYHCLPPGVGVVDLERGRMKDLSYNNWLTDTSVGNKSWGYITDEDYKSANTLVDVLIDIVSKNGCMLLNVGPKADGTIPEEARERLLEIGKWLEINGEAIYGTRPWSVYGEGPTNMAKAGAFSEEEEVQYTAEDIRFTVKGDVLYAICLDWPGETIKIGKLARKGTSGLFDGEIQSVSMLGDGKNLEWVLSEEGLTIKTPQKKPCDYAFVFKIVRK
jgi:alpha-L-fucosidase